MSTGNGNNPADFAEARRQAVSKAKEKLEEPVIVAWKDDSSGLSAPVIPGASSDRWHDYGESNKGKLQMDVGDAFHFIFAEAADYEEPDINLSSIKEDDGTAFLCVNNACTQADLEKLGYFSGGGMGD
jgi:hypothetical protein